MKLTTLLTSFTAITSLASAQVFWDGATPTPDNASQGGSGTWDTSTANWDDGSIVAWNNGANDTAVFGGTVGTVTLGADVTVGGLTFNTNGYIVDPDGSNLFDITFGTAGNIDVSAGTTTLNASIGGSSKITKTGSGELELRGANTFTGGFDIAGGTVNVTNGANEGAYFGATSNTVTFTGDSSLYNQNGEVTMGQNFTINSGVTATISGAFGETTTITGVFGGSGDLVVQGFSANFAVKLQNAANTFTGAIQINGSSGPARLEVNSLLDSTTSTAFGLKSDSNNGGTFIYNGSGTDALVFNNRQVTLTGNGNGGTNLGRQPKIQNDKSDSGATITINTDLAITGTGEKNFMLGGNNSGDNTFSGAIVDAIGTDVLNLYKQNGGKWILSGTNTYEGDTIVDAGTLELADGGQMKFLIGANGVNNGIIGDASNATLDLFGDFLIDLTNAGIVNGDFWTIVDVDNLNETFGGTFAVSSTLGLFANGGDIWSISENGVTYEFSELTGLLTVVPEPSSFALLAGCFGLAWVMVRRRG